MTFFLSFPLAVASQLPQLFLLQGIGHPRPNGLLSHRTTLLQCFEDLGGGETHFALGAAYQDGLTEGRENVAVWCVGVLCVACGVWSD